MKDFIFKDSVIRPTDVKIYYEDKIPYLEYTGEIMTSYGLSRVHFPKIDLGLKVIEYKCETEENIHGLYENVTYVKVNQQAHVSNDMWMKVQILERKMTKEQIEKELGYKIEIVED